MKSKDELKKELHLLIDSIEDEETLNILNDDIVPYVVQQAHLDETDMEDELTPAQELRLSEAIQQAKEGKVMSFDEFKSRMAKWHTR
jgi:uncharacterized protein YeaO (DUF488 family)